MLCDLRRIGDVIRIPTAKARREMVSILPSSAQCCRKRYGTHSDIGYRREMSALR